MKQMLMFSMTRVVGLGSQTYISKSVSFLFGCRS